MNRRSSKRPRYSHFSSVDEPEAARSATWSTSPLPTSASYTKDRILNSVLHPCSFEITLNHDQDLGRSLHVAPETAQEGWGTRLVTWTSISGQHTVVTDRFDAVNLLSELPSKQQRVDMPTEEEIGGDETHDVGWSDLDSDSEDLFYMTNAEATAFTRTKAKTRLESQHTCRLNALQSHSPSRSPSPSSAVNSTTDTESLLSRTQFTLMQRLAKSLSTSSNPSLLELKILAHHGSDARFSFLRPLPTPPHDTATLVLYNVWQQLKQSHGQTTYQETLSQSLPPTSALVAYDNSDSDSES